MKPYLSMRVFIIHPPKNQPELHVHFEAVASENGWRRFFEIVDKTSGERAVLIFKAPSEGGVA
mgnify:CR=1 FL=1